MTRSGRVRDTDLIMSNDLTFGEDKTRTVEGTTEDGIVKN